MLIYVSAHRHVFLRQFWWKIMKTAMNGKCRTWQKCRGQGAVAMSGTSSIPSSFARWWLKWDPILRTTRERNSSSCPKLRKSKHAKKHEKNKSLKDDVCFLAGIPSTCHSQLRVLVDNLTQFPNFRRRNYLLGSCDLTQSTRQGPCLSCRVWILKTLITIANDKRLPAAKWAPIYASRI